MLRNGKGIMESAITGSDGEVDAGYLALFWLMWLIIGVIPLMVLGSFYAMYHHATRVFDAQGLGVGIGAICGGFAAAVGGIGAFRMGDKPRQVAAAPAQMSAAISTPATAATATAPATPGMSASISSSAPADPAPLGKNP
jgi:hypothetical protein